MDSTELNEKIAEYRRLENERDNLYKKSNDFNRTITKFDLDINRDNRHLHKMEVLKESLSGYKKFRNLVIEASAIVGVSITFIIGMMTIALSQMNPVVAFLISSGLGTACSCIAYNDLIKARRSEFKFQSIADLEKKMEETKTMIAIKTRATKKLKKKVHKIRKIECKVSSKIESLSKEIYTGVNTRSFNNLINYDSPLLNGFYYVKNPIMKIMKK